MKRISPQPQWLYGDYLNGRSPKDIATLWDLPVEVIEGHLSMETRRRKKLQSTATPYVAPPKKPKRIAPNQRTVTAWLSIGQFARKMGMERADMVALVDTPAGEAMGIESRKRDVTAGGGTQYRINYEKVKK